MPSAAIVIHPSSINSPDILLRDLLDHAGDMKAIAFVYISENGEVSCGHSPSMNQQLALMQLALEQHVKHWIFEDG